MRMGLQYLAFRTGPMSFGASHVAVFARTRPEYDTPNVQFHFQPLSADKPGEGLHSYAAFTASVCQLRPESRGRIEIKTPDPYGYPSIQPNYLATHIDQQTAIEGIQLTRQLCASRAMGPFVEKELLPGEAVRSDDDLLQAARNISQTIYHPVGTCKMGVDAAAVVDERLRVRGMENLRIADASIMPAITSGNTNAPTIMIAEKAADMIVADLQSLNKHQR